MSKKQNLVVKLVFGVFFPLFAIVICVGILCLAAPTLLDSLFPPIETGAPSESTSGLPSETVKLPSWADDTPPDGSLERYYFYQLNESDKLLYIALLNGLETPTDTVVLRNSDYYAVGEALPRVAKAFAYDHPEFFWLSSSYTLHGEIHPNENDDILTVSFSTCDFWSADKAEEQTAALQAKVKQIADEARKLEGDYARVKFVHDYICRNTVYDRANSVTRNLELNSAYSCLIEGRAVCGGYANALHLVLEELGIPATVIAGHANGEAHMWSCVTLNEHNYLIDVTWDDTDKNGTNTYLYFGLTTEELQKSHTPETDFDHPLCTSLAYHYYRHEGLYLEQYDFSALSAIIAAQSGNAEATVKLASAAEFEKAINDLFTNGKWSSLPGFKGAVTVRYSIDEVHCILYLTFP